MKFKVLGTVACFAACFFMINYWSQVSFEIVKKEHRTLLQQLAIKQAIQIERNLKLVTNSHQWLVFELNANKQQLADLESLKPMIKHMMDFTPEIVAIDLSPNSVVNLSVPTDPNKQGTLIVPPANRVNQQNLHSSFYEPPYLDDKQRSILIKHLPVFIEKRFWGYVSYTLNLNLVFRHSQLDQLNSDQFNYQLVHTNKYKKESILVQSDKPLTNQIYVASINLPNANLLLKLSPLSQTYATNVIMNIVFSLSIASIFTLISYLGLTEPARLRTKLNNAVAKLDELQLVLASIVDNIHDEIIYTDTNGQVQVHNIQSRDHTHTPPNIIFDDYQSGADNPLFEYDGKTVIEAARHPINRALYNNELVSEQVMVISPTQEAKRIEMTSFPVKNSFKTIGALCIAQQQLTANQSLVGDLSRTAILEMLEKNKSLKEVFDYTINKTQRIVKDIVVSITLIDRKNNQINDVYATDLPNFYRHAIIGTPIHERLMSSNSAIKQNKMIIVEDINLHPYWINEKDIANQAGLRACWSHPVHDSEGNAIGSLDFYSTDVLQASPAAIVILKETALLVSLTMERHKDIYRLNKMSLAVQHTSSAVTIVDAQGAIEYINPKYSEISGYNPVDVIGTTSELFVISAQHNKINDEIVHAVNNGRSWTGETVCHTKSNERYWSHATITPILDQYDVISQVVISQENITYISPNGIDAENYQKSIDSLTGLFTQYTFVQQLDRLLRQPNNRQRVHCLSNLSINQYPNVLQTFGSNAADELLRQVGQLLNQTVRRRDTVARLSADQFVILMEDCHWQPATNSLEQLIENIESYSFMWRENAINITLSIGLTEIDEQKDTSELYLQRADIACLKAKDSNQAIVRYQHDFNAHAPTSGDLYWSQKLNHALDQDAFVLYVIPTHSADNNQQRCHDIILKLPVDNGLVDEVIFLPAASRYNLSGSIDKWVIEQTLQWLKHNSSLETHRLTINLSAATLQDPSFSLYLLELSEDNLALFNRLNFVFSEYVYTNHTACCQQLINAIAHTDVKFIISQYGQGFSSFNLLRDAKVDAVKLSDNLVTKLADEPLNRKLVGAITAFCQQLDLEVIAPPVTSQSALRALQDSGINHNQGLTQTPPSPLSELNS